MMFLGISNKQVAINLSDVYRYKIIEYGKVYLLGDVEFGFHWYNGYSFYAKDLRQDKSNYVEDASVRSLKKTVASWLGEDYKYL